MVVKVPVSASSPALELAAASPDRIAAPAPAHMPDSRRSTLPTPATTQTRLESPSTSPVSIKLGAEGRNARADQMRSET